IGDVNHLFVALRRDGDGRRRHNALFQFLVTLSVALFRLLSLTSVDRARSPGNRCGPARLQANTPSPLPCPLRNRARTDNRCHSRSASSTMSAHCAGAAAQAAARSPTHLLPPPCKPSAPNSISVRALGKESLASMPA